MVDRGVYYTGGSLNPARSFGPSVVLGTFYPYHWIYWVGPLLGSLLASGFYTLVKALEYETVSPAQDDDGEGLAMQDEKSDTATRTETNAQGDEIVSSASLYGGTVTAGPVPGGGWAVTADLDLESGSKPE